MTISNNPSSGELSPVQRWRKNPLTWLTAVLAIIYGIGFALDWWKDGSSMVWIGAAVVGLVFLA